MEEKGEEDTNERVIASKRDADEDGGIMESGKSIEGEKR